MDATDDLSANTSDACEDGTLYKYDGLLGQIEDLVAQALGFDKPWPFTMST